MILWREARGIDPDLVKDSEDGTHVDLSNMTTEDPVIIKNRQANECFNKANHGQSVSYDTDYSNRS